MKQQDGQRWQRMTGQLEDGCALFAGTIAGLGLWSWWAGFGDLLAFRSAFVPMAPSTALVMMAVSLAVFLLHRWPEDRNVVRFAWGAAGLAGVIGLWVALRPAFGWDSPVERWLSGTTRHVDHIPVGEMSPLSGAMFVAVALALLFRLLPAGRYPKAHKPVAILALGVMVAGLAMVGGYAIGRPWLYGSSVIPMALWTALAFVCLGFSLLGLAVVETSPVDAAVVVRGPILSLAQVAVTSFLVFIIGAFSALFLRHSLTDDRADASELLSAIGDLKAGEIFKWQQRRLQEAEVLARTTLVGQQLQRFLENPAEGSARAQAQSLLALIQEGDRYAAVAFFDTRSVLRLALPDTFDVQSASLRQLVAGVFRSNKVALSDLHRPAGAKAICLDVAFPVFAPVAPGAAGPTTAPVNQAGAVPGVLVLRIDAGRFLFPLIQTWPTHSRSAETLLVRREGDEVLFLNELRHQRGTALNLRLPISQQPDLPAARAVLGRTGLMEGVDYRGVPVLAVTRAVPRSPWFIVAKVDREEIDANHYEQAWLTLALTVVLATAAGMAVNLVGHRRHIADMRRELALAERIEHLMRNANDIIFLADEQWRLLEVNTRAVEVYGYTPAEFRTMCLADLRTAETRAKYDQDIAQLMAAGHALFETLHRRKDGSVFPVESSMRVIDIAGVSYRLAILRDITERKAQEREIQRLNRLYHTLSEINQSIVRIQSREELFQRVCQITAEFSGFKAVWLGWLDPETRAVRSVGRAGTERSYLDGLEFHAGDRPEGREAVGTCIREGRACIIQDLAHDPRTAHRREIAAAHGLRSAAAVPIRLGGKVCGAFTVYSNEPDIFQEKEIALLEEAATDISFALNTLERDSLRRQAEEALRGSEERLRLATEAARMGAWERDLKTNHLAWSPLAEQLNGYEPGTFPGTEEAFRGLLHPDCLAEYAAARRRVREGDGVYRAELHFRLRDGRERWGLVVGRLIRGQDGQPERIVGIDLDITERKRAEEALQQAEEKFRAIFEHATVGIFQSTPEGKLLTVNPAFATMHGYDSPAECLMTIRDIGRQLYVDPARRAEWSRRLEQEGRVLRFENQAYRKDGSVIWVSTSARVTRDAPGRILYYEGFVEDITERKRLEAERAEIEVHMRQQQKLESIGTLAGGVAHEINNPIMGIMNYAQLVADQAAPGSLGREYAREIIRETERVAGIVRNLLQFARQEKHSHSPARMEDIVEQTLSLIRAVMRHDQVTLKVEIPPDLPSFKCRSQQIQQVLMNLLTNARDALNDKYPGHHDDKVILLTCRMFHWEGRRWLRLTVEDHGNGIPESVRGRILDPFFTTKPRDKGTGLGLSISHGIVKEHHGQLLFETELGRYTRFHVELPVDNGWAL